MLRGQKIYLRALEPEDLELLYQWENNTTIWHLSHTVAPYSRKVLTEYINNSHFDIYTTRQLRFMICSDGDKAIGCVDLFEFDPQHLRAGIGILIADETERRKGLAADTLNTLKEYCKEKLNLHQIYCSIAIDNEASFQLFLNNGFKHSGTREQWQRTPKGYVSEYFMQCFLS